MSASPVSRWAILGVLTLARTATGFQFQSIASTAPLLVEELALNTTQIGLLVGLFMLPGAFVALPGGMLGARFGDKRVALAGLALMVLGSVAMAAAPSIVPASLARLTTGIGAVLFNVVVTKMMADWFSGRELVLAMSALVNSWPLGIALALVSLGPVAEHASLPAAFLLCAAAALLGLVVVALGYRAAPEAATQVGIRAAVLDRSERNQVLLAAMPWMLYNSAYALLVAFLPLHFFTQGNASLASAGSATALNALLLIASVQVGGLLAQKTGRGDLITHVGVLGAILSVTGLLTAPNSLLWLVLAGLFAGLPAGVLISLPAQVLRPQSRNAGMGLFYTAYYAGMAVFPWIGGRIVDATGSPEAAIWLAAATLMGCGLTFQAARRAQRSRLPPAT